MTNETLDTINGLGTVYMIAGSDQTFIFNCVDQNGGIINLTGSTCSMKISPIGQPNILSVSKSGVITSTVNGTWKIELVFADTSTLYGVYQIQPRIQDFSGTVFYPGQGILNISALIG